jgi:hypothetical protein
MAKDPMDASRSLTYVASLARRHTEACVNPGLFRTAKPRPGRG